jgi:hypothetical protein
MRILGDLDGSESHGRSDSRASGSNGSHEVENSSPPSGGESPKDEPAVEPRDQTGFAAPKPEHDPRKAFVGGVPSADPPAQPRAGGQFDHRTGDRIGEQRLERADEIDNRAQLSPRRSNLGVWFVLMVLALGLFGVCGYLYLALRNNNVTLSQVPELLRSVPALGGRLNATEAKLRGLTANWDGLTNHMAELDRKVDSSLRATRNQTRELVGQATGRLQAELDRRSEVVDARLNHVESMQRQDQAQLAQLNDQLRGQVSSLRQQLAAAQESNGRDLANMQEQVSNNQGDLHTLTQNLHRDKVTFEIVKNSPTELAPGVTLTVLKTDVDHQRFRGYVSLTNEGKTLWLNNLSAKEAVDLYAQTNSHPYSLIVTAVSPDGVVGYMLLPASA